MVSAKLAQSLFKSFMNDLTDIYIIPKIIVFTSKDTMKKIFQKKQKNNLYKLQIPFNIWHRKTILAEANENANIIQNQFRTYITSKHTIETLAKNKLQKIFRLNCILMFFFSFLSRLSNNPIKFRSIKIIIITSFFMIKHNLLS